MAFLARVNGKITIYSQDFGGTPWHLKENIIHLLAKEEAKTWFADVLAQDSPGCEQS